jgi:hypothetical protein
MNAFHGTPVLSADGLASDNPYLLALSDRSADDAAVTTALEQDKLVLIRSTSFDRAGVVFARLVDRYRLRDSYDVQMQYVVTLMSARDPVDHRAVTVNKRGPYQIIAPHAEGDSTSPLDLFGLFCHQNAESGGESILSLIDQGADHTSLRAKEKAIVGHDLSASEINKLRRHHLDAKDVLPEAPDACRVLLETPRARVVVRLVPVRPATSVISGAPVVTYWDNVTVHDHAFHRYQHQLLMHLGMLHARDGERGHESYMHVEDDSPWAPADTDSGGVVETSKLFTCHVWHKLAPGDFIVFNNRVWTHSANNWPPDQIRRVNALYA